MIWIFEGDSLARLQKMRSESVNCIVTSPPYYGLRDYQFIGQIGLERTVEEYIERLVVIFREARRVLRKDGTCWLNIGDSYAGGKGQSGHGDSEKQRSRVAAGESFSRAESHVGGRKKTRPTDDLAALRQCGVKPKDLLMIPARLMLALQADGWYIRQEIVWSKPNVMPESVRDRCTRSHEFVYMLTKQPKYYYDIEAIREAQVRGSCGSRFNAGKTAIHQLGRSSDKERVESGKRNRRSVWTIPTKPYKGAHFAVFPEALIEPCIMAGTSEHGHCSSCGAPWKRIVKPTAEYAKHLGKDWADYQKDQDEGRGHFTDESGVKSSQRCVKRNAPSLTASYETVGWQPTCACGAPAGTRSDDLELVLTPTGERIGEDPSIFTGRAGFNRPRGLHEGSRPITRFEQRSYAAQVKSSPHFEDMKAEAGSAIAHYVRTDRSGARPVPDYLLEAWISRGWLARAATPAWQAPPVRPGVVFDMFAGSGTTGVVALKLGRRAVLIEANPNYVDLIYQRCGIEREAELAATGD